MKNVIYGFNIFKTLFFSSCLGLISAPSFIILQYFILPYKITLPNFYGGLFYKLSRVKGETNFISSGSKIVKRLRRRQYDPVIIERIICLVLGPFTSLYRSFLKRCTLTKRRLGLSDGPDLILLKDDRVLIPVPSNC